MTPLVELHQFAAARLELREQPGEGVAVGLGRPLGCEARRLGLEHEPHLREPRQLAYVDARHEHAPARVHLDEPLVGESPEGLADRRPPDPEPLDQLPLVDQRTRSQLE